MVVAAAVDTTITVVAINETIMTITTLEGMIMMAKLMVICEVEIIITVIILATNGIKTNYINHS